MQKAPDRITLVNCKAMAHVPLWQFRMLGQPRLVSPEGGTSRCDRKPLAILSFLALEGPTSRSRLAGLLWPDTLESTARNNLVQLLRRMRRTYNEDLIVPADPLTLQLSARVTSDVQAGWTTSTDAGIQGPETGVLLEGTDFDDMPDLADWLLAQREQVDARRGEALTRLAQELEETGRLPEAIDITQKLLELNPLSEEQYRRLMRLQYLHNDRPAALQSYQRCQQVLARELGVEPMPVTALLAQEIERGTVQVGPHISPQLPLSVRRPAVLVGRSAEWHLLEQAWQQGQFIILAGAPGVGKSRLMHDFVATKGPVLRVEARPGDLLVPYATTARNLQGILTAHPEVKLKPWQRRALAPLLPDLLEDGDLNVPNEVPLHAVIQELFQIGTRDVTAIVYEDMQYADPASIEAGLVLISSAFPLGQPGGVPHMVCTVRDEELNSMTAETFREMARTGLAAQIAVPPLNDQAVAALLDQLELPLSGVLKRRMGQFAGGNPLYLLETVRSLIEQGGTGQALPERLPIPDKVSRIIGRRLDRLSSGALNTARAASILQSDFHIELIAEVLGAPLFDIARDWEELESAQIMQGETFSHDLIYESILQGIPDPIRRLLHRSAARALTRSGFPRARIALQWQQSGQLHEAAPLFVEAAEEASRLGRFHEAEGFLGTAVELYQSLGDVQRAAALTGLASTGADRGFAP